MTHKIALAAIGAAMVALAPAAAMADAQRSINAFQDVAASPDKLAAYCAMVKLIDEVGDDESKAKAAEDQIDGYLTTLGAEFEAAWAGGDDVPDGSPDLEKIENALADLDSKCGD
jgi:hypothetical protein